MLDRGLAVTVDDDHDPPSGQSVFVNVTVGGGACMIVARMRIVSARVDDDDECLGAVVVVHRVSAALGIDVGPGLDTGVMRLMFWIGT